MAHNQWSNPEVIKKLRSALITDPNTNQILNYQEVAEQFNITAYTLRRRIYKLRRTGFLPPLELQNQFEEYQRPYSGQEIERIIAMFQAGASVQMVADRFGRTRKGIAWLKSRLITAGQLEYDARPWTRDDEQLLIVNFKSDANWINTNANELAFILQRSRIAIEHRISKLRNEDRLPKPKRLGGSDLNLKERCEYHNKLISFIYREAKHASIYRRGS